MGTCTRQTSVTKARVRMRSEMDWRCRSCWRSASASAFDGQAAAQRHGSQVFPGVARRLANEGKLLNQHAPAALVLRPPLLGKLKGVVSLRLRRNLHDGQVRHVGPGFLGPQSVAV